jgi:hypothetical protein
VWHARRTVLPRTCATGKNDDIFQGDYLMAINGEATSDVQDTFRIRAERNAVAASIRYGDFQGRAVRDRHELTKPAVQAPWRVTQSKTNGLSSKKSRQRSRCGVLFIAQTSAVDTLLSEESPDAVAVLISSGYHE